MLLKFLKRAWMPYCVSVCGVSTLLGIIFTMTSGGGRFDDIVTLILGTFMIAAPISLFLGMPIAFWGWYVQQRRSISLTEWSAAAVAFGAGTLLHLVFLMCFGGFLLPPQILMTTALCGGLYGAVFAFWFSR